MTETYTHNASHGVFHWDPPLKRYAGIARLHPATLFVDRDASNERLCFLQDLFGDILDVRRGGVDFCRCGLTRKLIMLRGLESFFLDFHDAPDFVRTLMGFLRLFDMFAWAAWSGRI